MPNQAQEIDGLLRTVLRLMQTHTGKWFTWRWISREHRGTEEFADSLEGLSWLPSIAQYFVRFQDSRVKLSEAGIRRATEADREKSPLPPVRLVAQAVLDYARSLEKQVLRVAGVSTVARAQGRFIQAVHVDLDEVLIPSEAPVEFRPERAAPTRGKIVGQEPDGAVLYVAFEREVLSEDLPAVLRVDRGFLLQQLSQQLDRLPEFPPLAIPVLLGSDGLGPPPVHPDSGEMAAVLAASTAPWTRFLWGPPGSGKTFALARLATHLLRGSPDERILLLAPSNRAVDVALVQLVDQLEAVGLGALIAQRRILRFGYPRLPAVLGRPELLGPEALDQLAEEVRRLANEIGKAERAQQPEVEIAHLRTQLLSAQDKIKVAVAEHVRQCRVVATTTTLGYLESSPIPSMRWGTVLVDETTMVPPAMCIYFASLAANRLLLAGDPRQLGPVVEASGSLPPLARSLMGRDVFEIGKLSTGEGEARTIHERDSRLAQITSQRRCAEEIWGRVSGLYPRIQCAVDRAALRPLADLPPLPGQPVVVLDTSESGSAATCRNVQRSWENRYSAELAMEVAGTIAAEAPPRTRIAIISPYRAQNRLLRRWIRGERSFNAAFETIDVGTVHQYQGSDADVVIFDLVDGAGRPSVGGMLTGDAGLRLVNVAITRARGKLVVLADRAWFQRRLARSDNGLLYGLLCGSDGVRLRVSPPEEETKSEECESPIEVLLFEVMIERAPLRGVRKQYVIRDEAGRIVSRADFAFPELRYAVYCDGRQWHLREDRWQRDLRQRNELTALGWRISVFSGSDVHRDASACADTIERTVRELMTKSR